MANIDFQPMEEQQTSSIDFQPMQTSGQSPLPSTVSLSNPQVPQGTMAPPLEAMQQSMHQPGALIGGVGEEVADLGAQAVGASKPTMPISVQAAELEYPNTAMVGNIIGAVGTAGVLAAGASIGAGLLTGGGLLTDIGANMAVSGLLAGPGSRVSGALIGGAFSLAAPIVGSLSNYTSQALTIGTKMKSFMSGVNATIKGPPGTIMAKSQANLFNATEKVDSQLFNGFRSAPGKISVTPTLSSAATFLKDNQDILSATQQKSITDLMTNSAKAKTLADLHDARKIFAYDYGKFTEGKPLTGTAYNQFKDLNNTLAMDMKANAEVLGVGNQYNAANTHYQESLLPLINTGAKDTANILANSTKDPMAAAKVADITMGKYLNPNNPQVTKTFLNSLDDTGRQAAEVSMVNKVFQGATSKSGSINPLYVQQGLGDLVNKVGFAISPTTTQMIKGLNVSIEEATHLGGMEANLSGLRIGQKAQAIGATIAGAGATGATASIAGGAVGSAAAMTGLYSAGATALVGMGLYKMSQTKMGQDLLIQAGSATGRAIGKQIVNGILIQGALRANPYSDGSQ